MSEQDLSSVANTSISESESSEDNSAASENHVLAKLILEIQQTPEEYLPNFLQIVRLFRESVTMKSVRSHTSEQNATPETLEANRLAQQYKALNELTRLWIEQGDEQEQTETAEILRKALEEEPVSI